MNFAKGILESRKQHYKALKSVLKPVPLNTPTDVEIGLEHFIRVTLLDANHCAGAVMFLIEDTQKAILYTGDIRSETWWINSLTRNPAMIPYALGIQRLDNVYLDTTFATKDKRYQRFQSKADGIKELLEKALKYPAETVIHFHAWTLGYEDVWIALSSALKTQVHVDDYKCLLYGSLASENPSLFHYHEGPALFGYKNGNHFQKGCLTEDRTVRLHSCEHGTGCPALSSPTTVYITPIMNRDESGEILPEIGAGGGGGDLLQNHGYLELEDRRSVESLLEMCNKKVEDLTMRSKIRDMVNMAVGSSHKAISLDDVSLRSLKGDIKVEEFVENLVKAVSSHKKGADVNAEETAAERVASRNGLPCRIQFPYSRHSSYEELCELVATLRPRDIYPCTTDWQEWSWDESVENLFGHLSDMTLAYDQEMASLESQRATSRGVKRPHSPPESPRMTASQVEGLHSSQASAGGAEEILVRQCQGPLGPLEVEGLTYPKRRIDELRRSFERPLEAAKAQSELNASISSPEPVAPLLGALTTNSSSSPPLINDGDLQELASYWSFSMGELGPSTRAKRVELSDDASPKVDSQIQDVSLMDDLPEPDNTVVSNVDLHPREETQITLPDAAFESQLFNVTPQEHEVRLQYRKQAYIAARDLNGTWAEDHSLLSSGADHGEEEMEL